MINIINYDNRIELLFYAIKKLKLFKGFDIVKIIAGATGIISLIAFGTNILSFSFENEIRNRIKSNNTKLYLNGVSGVIVKDGLVETIHFLESNDVVIEANRHRLTGLENKRYVTIKKLKE